MSISCCFETFYIYKPKIQAYFITMQMKLDNHKLNEELVLPCGVVLKNRIAKSAMSENMSTPDHKANVGFEKCYKTWASGGTGLLITGNVMVDRFHLGEPRNIVIERNEDGLDSLKLWAESGTINNTHLWIQLNHPGKQSPKFLTQTPVAPSALPFESSLSKVFNTPRSLSEVEIQNIIERFINAAVISKKAGFTGVQIHGAHGYLVSQFLSPRHNQRSDRWGGTLDNRMRFVLNIYEGMRSSLGKHFPIGIKLNSSDFQKGGFSEEESTIVAKTLSDAGIDLIEISGGTYESPEMTGVNKDKQKKSTAQREAYFLEYCEKVRSVVKTPLMLTGGFRTLEGASKALSTGVCDVIGLARALTLNPQLSQAWLEGRPLLSEVRPLSTGIGKLDKLFPLEIVWYTEQIHRLSNGKNPDPNLSPFFLVLKNLYQFGVLSLRRVRA